MNIIWSSLVIFCFIFSFISGNVNKLIDSLFDIPSDVIKLLISLGSLIIIYNGIFQIAIDSNLIKKISKIFKPFVKFIYTDLDENTIDLLSANFCANLLGLSSASTPIVIKAINKLNERNLIKIVCMNVSCFSLFSFSIITLRSQYGGLKEFELWLFLIIITLLSTLFSLFICRLEERK